MAPIAEPEQLFSVSSVSSVSRSAREALKVLGRSCGSHIPQEGRRRIGDVKFNAPVGKEDAVLFPCPLKEHEAVAAIKGLEACMISALADLRFGAQPRNPSVDMMRVACFIMSGYMTTLDGLSKADPKVKKYLYDTDINKAQSILYRRLSANLYKTSDAGKYYHIHGSLEASRNLEMIHLPAFNEELTEYRECINTIEAAVRKFSVSELEKRNLENRQAGAPALTQAEFLETPHGKTMMDVPPFRVESFGPKTTPTPFDEVSSESTSSRQLLEGIRVVEFCRVIAGPTIGRSLAALGADVLKVTSKYLPDVPFFQVDGNTGKHTTPLELKNLKECKVNHETPLDLKKCRKQHITSPGPSPLDFTVARDRETFEKLLETADVVVDGYRPGSLDSLGYGPEKLAEIAERRKKGFVYVVEDCFGGTGIEGAQFFDRPGWQMIADCITGVAWRQGEFMHPDAPEPVVPPFPMSDYGTGAMGGVAALVGLYRRATEGGSWACRTSLVQYDMFLLSLGAQSDKVKQTLRKQHDPAFFGLRYNDSVDEVGKRALASMRRVHPELFADELMQTAWSPGFGADIKWPRESVKVDGLTIGYSRPTRPNGYDQEATWDGWERDEEMLAGRNRPRGSN